MTSAALRLVPFSYWDFVTLAASSEAAGFPVTYLQNSLVSWRHRTTSLVDQWVSGPLSAGGNLVGVNCFAAVGSNLTAAGQYRLELATDAAFSNLVLDETIDARLPEYGFGEGGYGEHGYGGHVDDVSGQNLRVYWFALRGASHARVTLIDPDNPDGYFAHGKLLWGSSWSPSLSHDWGAQYRPLKTGQLVRATGGGLRGTPSTRYREIVVGFSWLDEFRDAELDRILAYYGMGPGVLLSCYPEEGGTRERKYTLYGSLTEWSGSARLETRDYSNGIKVQESK